MLEPQIYDYQYIEDYYDALDEYNLKEEEKKLFIDFVRKETKAFHKRLFEKLDDPADKEILDILHNNYQDERPIATTTDIIRIHNMFSKTKTHGLCFYRKVLDELQNYNVTVELREANPWIDQIYVKWNELEIKDIERRKKENLAEEARKQRALETRNNKTYKCYECEIFTNNRKIWEEHIGSRDHFIKTNDHEGLSKLKCKACGKDDFNNLIEIERHTKTLSCVELRTCPICKKVCSRKQTYLDHFRECKNKMEEMKKQLENFNSLSQK